MILYPAIDIFLGKCVRLHKGDFNKKTEYDSDPLDVAKKFKEDGAEWVHIVDLDGAKNPDNRQTKLIQDIIAASGLKVQTGGGIRNAKDVDNLLKAGASRVVIGSLAVKEPQLTRQIIQNFGADKVCLAADAVETNDNFMIAFSGWQENSDLSLIDFLTIYDGIGVKHILCTDISRDGTMQGCNDKLYSMLVSKFPHFYFQASGGIHNLEDLRSLPTKGAIIGKALYEGAFSLKQALEVVKNAG